MTDKNNEKDQNSSTPTDPWTDSPQQQEPAETSAAKAVDSKRETKGGDEEVSESAWQQDLINRLAFASLNEQRRARRWGIFFKFLIFAYIFFIFFYIPKDWGTGDIKIGGKHTALIEVSGVIADNMPASADTVVTGLRDAFEDKNTAGIILRINSPGGSPVQSGYIYDEIMRLKGLNPEIPVYAVITDICASGGYYIASAADEIYADKASMVGSIGVLMNGFGFTGTMEKVGVERRLMTAGANKGFLDPFSPLKEEEVSHVKGLLGNIHQQFIDAVKNGRGERLSESPDIFTGLIWTGEQGVQLGLVDALGSSSYVARDVIGAEKIVDFTPRPDYWERFADRIGMTMANGLSEQFSMSLR